MLIKNEFWCLLCRGRKKKIFALAIILLFLLNAMLYISFELYNTVKRKRKDPWYKSLRFDKNSYEDENGMRVIVGHYMGGRKGVNLSDDIINSNRYAPLEGAGEYGRPVQLSPRELISAGSMYPLHSFNIVVSDKISINRSLPDMRSESCQLLQYNLENLPTASIVIIFHNEAWSTLFRTVMSVLNRSPPSLLKEVILVDDASTRMYLAKQLENAVAKINKVRLLRIPEREGLVAARLTGARAAVGDVLVFLDSHCEVTYGWLEPLLDRAGSDDVFICPHIDMISEDTFAYTKTIDGSLGAFNWGLNFRWFTLSKEMLRTHLFTKPYPSPAMAGGLFAVRRSLFWRLGGYDEGMRIWGGENLELSFRAWQCGARVEITHCSRVGHIFRRSSPYKYPGGVAHVLNSNLARVALVWMDEWGEFVFRFNQEIDTLRDQQNVAHRIELRKSLHCKSFKWYLENVWKEHFFPTEERWFGMIRNGRGACLAVTPGMTVAMGSPAAGVGCGDDRDLGTMVIYTPERRIMANEGVCLEQGNGRAVWKLCSDSYLQHWEQKGPRLKTTSGLCLTLRTVNSTDGVGDPLLGSKCVDSDSQIWHFDRVPWH